MPLAELTRKKVESALGDFCQKRIPSHVRNQIRLTFEFRANSVTLFEDRPVYNNPSRWTHSAIAQFRFDDKALRWTLFYRDRNEKWHKYVGLFATPSFDDLLAEVDRDPTGIFWGSGNRWGVSGESPRSKPLSDMTKLNSITISESSVGERVRIEIESWFPETSTKSHHG